MSAVPVSSAPNAGSVAPLAGKVALVTGGSRGLGAAIAAGLAADGAQTVIWYRRDARAASDVVSAIAESGGAVTARQVDVTSRDEVTEAVSLLVREFGTIDILINNAGLMRRAPFLEIEDEDWLAVVATDLTAYFVVSQVVARVMALQGHGSIVHISSTNDQITSVDCTAYAVAKGGVGMLTKQMAAELGPLGIRVNAIAPGMVETDLNRGELADPLFRKHALSRMPLGRLVEPTDVADAVRYLVSDRARSMHGATIRVDAGRTVS